MLAARCKRRSKSFRAEPTLSDLESPLASLEKDLSRWEADRKAEKESDETYAKFIALRDSALFHGMVLTGVEVSANISATKKDCREALALVGMAGQSAAAPNFSTFLSASRRRQCVNACYELLLIWADAEAQPVAGKGGPSSQQLRQAIELLDRASKLDVLSTRAYHLRRAIYLELLGDTASVQKEVNLSSVTEPNSALDYFLMGDSKQKQGKTREAADYFASALAKQPDHFWAQYFLAVCNLQLQQMARARDNLTNCIVARRDFVWLYMLRGFANGQLNQFKNADEDFAIALSQPHDRQAQYGILVNQGLICLRQARQIEGPLSLPGHSNTVPTTELLSRGILEACREERLAAAQRYIEEAINLLPEQGSAYRYLVAVFEQQKRSDDALKLLDKTIETSARWDPSVQGQLYGQRAQLHRERINLTEAQQDIDRALELYPSAANYLENGRIQFARLRYPQAINSYRSAEALSPDEPETYRYQAETFLASHQYVEAATALDSYFLKQGRATAEVYRARGLARARSRQYSDALADYTHALSLRKDAATYAGRGWIYLANDVLSLAHQDFEEAIRLDANQAEAYAGRGLIRVRRRQHVEAAADAEAALLRAKPETGRLLWNITHIYAQLAGADEASDRSPKSISTAARIRYRQMSLELLRRALELVPELERPVFWRQYIATDALLKPIQNMPGFDELERKYGKPTKGMFGSIN